MVDSEEDSDVDTGFYSDGEEVPPHKRRSLLVALSTMADLSLPTTPQVSTCTSTSFSKAFNKNLKCPLLEIKGYELAVPLLSCVLTAFNETNSFHVMHKYLFAKQMPVKATPRKRKIEPQAGSERRNPSRKARPPENFAVEEKSEPVEHRSPRPIDIRKLVEVQRERVGERRRKRRSSGSRRSQYVVKTVDDITKEDLDNIAYRSKDKIWDKDNGSSCHQCRQKTLDTKTVCRSGYCVGVKGQFCGPCLKNRYGEDVRTVLLDPVSWSCPICRGMCNCSLCRKKEGRCATGILVGLARYNGHNNVHEYLVSIQKELQ
uniref:Cell division cycle associated 7b n=1 Tax=Mastacembelus armatus TaxID=205130 RepID=A0A7N8Y8G6_9TELE